MMNFGTWKAHGLRVLWFGGMVNPDALSQACEVILENIKSLTGKDGSFRKALLVVRPRSDGAVLNYTGRLVPGKEHYVMASDTLTAARGLAQMMAMRYGVRGDSSALLVPLGGE